MIYPDIIRFDFRDHNRQAAHHRGKMESYRSMIDGAIKTPIIGRYLAHINISQTVTNEE
ncbi:MAG TPA: hypothetical protein VJH04_03365 [archaeon]|nr:hypothetical protein [archaeon]